VVFLHQLARIELLQGDPGLSYSVLQLRIARLPRTALVINF